MNINQSKIESINYFADEGINLLKSNKYNLKDFAKILTNSWHVKKNLTLHSKVFYEENVFVIFLNSSKSIHGITSRKKTQSTRNLTNIIFETYKYKKLFNLDRNKNFFANFFKKFI